MIFDLFRKLKEAGILGMNQRNAAYIMSYNARSAFPLVDNKIETKRLAGEYGIPVPEVYAVIERHDRIAHLEEDLGDRTSFVVKPARGAGGSGIILITDRTGQEFITTGGNRVSPEEMRYHLSDILSGVFSLEGLEDCAIVEALIYPDEIFSAISYMGVPDIRIIVYRGFPVMAMVRLPTKASDGKANLHRGGIGAGIDLADGTTRAAIHNTGIVSHHPDTQAPIAGIAVPHWDRMLLMAARAYEMTGLGYLGVDLVLDREKGPLLLELNARPGLAIQLANMAGLRLRLETVDKAATGGPHSAEGRVEWAKQQFA